MNSSVITKLLVACVSMQHVVTYFSPDNDDRLFGWLEMCDFVKV